MNNKVRKKLGFLFCGKMILSILIISILYIANNAPTNSEVVEQKSESTEQTTNIICSGITKILEQSDNTTLENSLKASLKEKKKEVLTKEETKTKVKTKKEKKVEVEKSTTSIKYDYDTWIPQEYVNYAVEISNLYDNLDAALLIAVIESESSGQPNVVSSCGAVGLMQIIPRFQYERMSRLGVTNLYDPYSNILVGADMLSELIAKYQSVHLALIGYGEGEYSGAIERGMAGYYPNYVINRVYRANELRYY